MKRIRLSDTLYPSGLERGEAMWKGYGGISDIVQNIPGTSVKTGRRYCRRRSLSPLLFRR